MKNERNTENHSGIILNLNKQHNTLRNNQKIPEGDWLFWLLMAGRGFGKTFAGAHCVVYWIYNKIKRKICLIGATYLEAKQVMVSGPSGILTILHDNYNLKYQYKSSSNYILFENGVEVFIFSGDKPDKLRGFQFDGIWIDEFAKMQYHEGVLQQTIFCTRIGRPHIIITTTPKPLKIIEFLLKRNDVIVSRGTSYENMSNLSESYRSLLNIYEGTRIGKQEIYGEVVFGNSSPWYNVKINYLENEEELNNISLRVMGIDPSVRNRNETGIVICGYNHLNTKIYVLDDLSVSIDVNKWIPYVCDLCEKYKVDVLAIEINQGGDLIPYAITNTINYEVKIETFFAKQCKLTRAISLSHLYNREKIIHKEKFHMLEKQMFEFTGTKDRIDSLYYAVEYILNNREKSREKSKNDMIKCHLFEN